MKTRIASLFAGLFLLMLAAPAFAQINGGVEAREFWVIVDPDGAAVHAATVWFGDTYMDSIWVAVDKVDAGDLYGDIKLEDQGVSYVPTTLSTSYSSSTLSSTVGYNNVHTFRRSSDNQVDLMMSVDIEGSCSYDCYVVSLDFLKVYDLESDLGNPTLSTYQFDFTSTFYGISGDVVEAQSVQ